MEELKYLHTDFSKFPSQSIPCRLGLKKLQQVFGRRYVFNGLWSMAIRETFYGALKDKVFGIVPVTRVKVNMHEHL